MRLSVIIKNIFGILVGICCFLQFCSAKSISRLKNNTIAVKFPGNIPPVANAGNSQQITHPLDSVLLDGSTSYDPDGTIVSYQWDYLTGPGVYQFADTNLAIVRVRDLKVGIYLFQLTVTDNSGAISSDTVSVVVNIMPTPPPTDTDVINCGHAFTIVVLGSSTAYGTGATPIDSSWVNKYTGYITAKNSKNKIINLAMSGYTTYQVLCPDNFIPPAYRPSPDTAHNISAALNYHPNAIIINLPTNDVANGYTMTEQQANYARTLAVADSANIPVWVTTSQPRNDITDNQRDSLKVLRDWTLTTFGNKALDFWTTVADTNGDIVNVYNYDNIHVDNYGHYIFFIRVVASKILDSLCNRLSLLVPVAIAGNDTTITLPNNTVSLNGTASYENGGIIAEYLWRKISGPAQYNIIDTTASSTTANNLVAGNYQFALIITDNYGLQSSDTLNVVVKNNIILAIGNLIFTAITSSNSVKIILNTQNDVDVVEYEIQRSSNGINFSPIGTLSSNQSELPAIYYYLDNNPLAGINYYRVKIYNSNGGISYSNIILQNFKNNSGAIFVYPNPVESNLVIHFNGIDKGFYFVRVMSNDGKIILTKQLAYNGTEETMKINLPVTASKGIYWVCLNKDAIFYKESFLVK